MNTDRIKEIQSKTDHPYSISVREALLQVWKECEQEKLRMGAVISSAIAFAEWVDWNKYERFEGRRDLWYHKKSSYSPIKTTKDLWDEFVKHCHRTNVLQIPEGGD